MSMTEYKSTPKQRRVLRKHHAIIKLHQPTMNPPKSKEIDWNEYVELVKYLYELDYLCHSENIVEKSHLEPKE